MSAIYPFPAPHRDRVGTIHVWGDRRQGFSFSHESASGDSWGELHGPYATGQQAIAGAYALNRDVYGSACNVLVSDAAKGDLFPDPIAPSLREDR